MIAALDLNHKTTPLRHFLWVQRAPLQLAIGGFLGCLCYFLLQFEPALKTWTLFAIAAILTGFWQRNIIYLILSFLCFFGWSQFSTYQIAQSYTPIEEGRYWVTGRIMAMHPSESRISFVLKDVTVYQSDAKLRSVRISVAASRWPEGLSIGHGVATSAYLSPPRTPQFWGDFDGRLSSFFTAPQAFGYVMGSFDATYIPHDFSGWRRTVADIEYHIQAIRFRIAERVAPHSYGLLAALLVGERGYLSDETWQAFRDSGLAHLLAISGMHLGFFAGGIFFFLRWLIVRLVPTLALHYPIKRIAAGAALISAFIYMLLAGSTIPTIRAFILLAALFGAIMLGRQRLVLRALALASLLILVLWPQSAVTASFQLSFTAALALALYFYAYEARERHRFRPNRRARYLPLVLLSSVVAGLMTLPLSILHFSHASLSGIFVNLIAIPLTAFVVMPSAILTFLALPLNLADPAIWLMAQGTNFLYLAAQWGANWPLNGLHVPTWGAFIIAPLALYALYAFFQEQFRRAMLIFALIISMLMVLPLLKSTNYFVTLANGEIILQRLKNNIFQQLKPTHDELLTYDQRRLLERFLDRHRATLSTTAPKDTCDATGCILTQYQQHIFLPSTIATAEDCTLNDVILTPHKPWPDCAAWVPYLTSTQKIDLRTNKQQTFQAAHARAWQQVHTP